jgi:aspartate aminotransferase
MILVNSPNNPSGAVYARGEMEALVEWCLSRDVLILSDEIYDRIVYDGLESPSPAALGPEAAAQTITVNGVSKAFAMTGWRIGFMTAPLAVAKAVVKFQGQTTGNPAAVSQAAALAALRGPQSVVEEMRAAYERRRNHVLDGLRNVPGVEVEIPHGAFYVFPRVADAARKLGGSLPVVERLVEAGVALVPGGGFGADDHVRLSFAVDDERLAEGIRRFRAGLQALV